MPGRVRRRTAARELIRINSGHEIRWLKAFEPSSANGSKSGTCSFTNAYATATQRFLFWLSNFDSTILKIRQTQFGAMEARTRVKADGTRKTWRAGRGGGTRRTWPSLSGALTVATPAKKERAPYKAEPHGNDATTNSSETLRPLAHTALEGNRLTHVRRTRK